MKNETPYTPSLPTFYGLRQALRGLEADGLANRWLEHAGAAAKARQAVAECGFSNFAEKGFESQTITTFLPAVDQEDAIKKAKAAQGIQIAGVKANGKAKCFASPGLDRLNAVPSMHA